MTDGEYSFAAKLPVQQVLLKHSACIIWSLYHILFCALQLKFILYIADKEDGREVTTARPEVSSYVQTTSSKEPCMFLC